MDAAADVYIGTIVTGAALGSLGGAVSAWEDPGFLPLPAALAAFSFWGAMIGAMCGVASPVILPAYCIHRGIKCIQAA